MSANMLAKLSKANIPLHLRNECLKPKFENVFKLLIDVIDKYKIIFVYGKPSLDKEIFITNLLKFFIKKNLDCLYCLPNSIDTVLNCRVVALMHMESMDSEYIKKAQELILNMIHKGGVVIIDCKNELKFRNLFGEDFGTYVSSVGIGVEVETDVESICIIKGE